MPPSGPLSRPHTIEDEGTPLGQKPKLNFVGAGVTAANVGSKTVVTIPGGDGSGELDAHLADAAAAHAASAISFAPTGTVAATNVQEALAEIASEGGAGTSEINMKGFRSINAYGAAQGVATDQTSAVEACQDALAADGGGILLQPPGVTYVKGPITQRAGITFLGCGAGASTWGFNTISGSDTGAGTYGFLPASQNSPLRIKGTRIVGPAVNVGESQYLGVNPCGISAIKVSRDSLIEDVKIDRFHAGIGVWADHITFNKVLVQNCYAAAEYLASTSRGDHTYNDCIFSGNLLAGILVLSGADINHSSFNNLHVVSTPFGFLRTGSHTTGFMNNVVLNRPAFENVGNGAIADLSTNGQPSFANCEINGSGYVQNDAYKYASLSAAYAINLAGDCTGSLIRNDFYPFTPGTSGDTYHFGSGMVDILGGNTTYNRFSATTSGKLWWPLTRLVLYQQIVTAGTVAVGDLLEYTATGTVQRATGTALTKSLAGVALEAKTVGQLVQMQTFQVRGGVAILSETVAQGAPLAQKTGTYNVLGPASSYPANPVLGFAYAAGGNAGATATVTMVPPIPMLGMP